MSSHILFLAPAPSLFVTLNRTEIEIDTGCCCAHSYIFVRILMIVVFLVLYRCFGEYMSLVLHLHYSCLDLDSG